MSPTAHPPAANLVAIEAPRPGPAPTIASTFVTRRTPLAPTDPYARGDDARRGSGAHLTRSGAAMRPLSLGSFALRQPSHLPPDRAVGQVVDVQGVSQQRWMCRSGPGGPGTISTSC